MKKHSSYIETNPTDLENRMKILQYKDGDIIILQLRSEYASVEVCEEVGNILRNALIKAWHKDAIVVVLPGKVNLSILRKKGALGLAAESL